MKKSYIACNDCDLLMAIPALKHRQKAICPRCGYVLTRFYQHAQTKLLISAITGIVFLFFSLMFPFLLFNLNGSEQTLTLLQSIQTYTDLSYLFISLLLIFTALVIPMCFLLCVVYISFSFTLKKLLPYTNTVLKLTLLLKPWNMAEIFLIGVIISFIKVQTMAQVEFGTSFIFYLLFIVSLISTFAYFDRYQLWSMYQYKVKRFKQSKQAMNVNS